jgi:hypothetical protein
MAVERLRKFEKDRFQPHIETFNQNDSEAEVNVLPNRESINQIVSLNTR